MSQAPTSASGLVKVTVASRSRRVDLVLPGAVPVAELVPELARGVGLLDPGTADGGYWLLTREGRRLAGDAGLTMQRVEDGALLTVAAGVDEVPPRVYDDVVEAMADVVEHDFAPWGAAAGRRTSLTAAGLLMSLGAIALFIRDEALAAVTAALMALGLVAGALVLSRIRDEPEASVVMAWIGALHAAVAGCLLAPDAVAVGSAVAWAGAGAMLAGLIALVGLGEGRPLLIPPVVVGAISLVTGLVVQVAALDPAVVLTVALVFVVMTGSALPWLALGATGTTAHPSYSPGDLDAHHVEVDPRRVAADARVAHEILAALSGTAGLLLVLVAPVAVSLGVAGTLLALDCCLVVMLRTRHLRTGSEVLVGLVSGIAGLVSVAVALLWLHPDWRAVVAVALAATGTVLLAVTLRTATPSVRSGRYGDLAESGSLLALLPLLVLATGTLGAIRN